MKTRDWVRRAKKRCKYLVISLILLAFCVPTSFSYYGEAETEEEPAAPEPSAVPANPSNTTAQGFKGTGSTSVHAQTIKNNVSLNLKNNLSGARLQVEVDQPFQQGNRGFANGTSCIFATVEVITSQGVFLENEPLVIEKPDSITINGPTNSSGGSFRWCITSTQPIQANITVKLANFPRTQTTFNVNFLPTLTISNKTSSSNFIFDQPITFLAQIAPWMVQGLKTAKVTYNTARCRCGTGACENIVAEENLNCSFNGICSANIPASFTESDVNSRTQSFNYTFIFEDTNGNKFQQTFAGNLKFP